MNTPIPEIPIETLEQAKKFFIYMDCSLFHMGREYPQRYAEYKNLNIPKQTDNEWRRDKFYEISSKIMENPSSDSTWRLHSQMHDLFVSLRTKDEVLKMLEVTKYIRDKVPANDRVIIAETINGRARREARSGLIYGAYDSGDIATAKEFAELSLAYSSFDDSNKWKFWDKSKQRNQRATQMCKEIMNELGLE